jgi:hypothetical protein
MNEKLLQANGRKIRYHGTIYRIISHNINGKTLCEADPIVGPNKIRVNLVKSRTALALEPRKLVDLNIFV